MAEAFELGFVTLLPDDSDTRTFSLLSGGTSNYDLGAESFIFKEDHSSTDDSWFTMSIKLPYTQSCSNIIQNGMDWAGTPQLRPTQEGPLFTVEHDIRMTLHLTYDLPGEQGRQAEQNLEIILPTKFARKAPSLSPPTWFPTPQLESEMTSLSTGPSYTPHSLPAYSQLFYSNGDRKIDPTPLPRYTPREKHYIDLSQPIPYSKLYDQDEPMDLSNESAPLLS
jgi:hypothetical protein